MKNKFTKEQKQEYFKKLRIDWKKSKELAENDEVSKALFRECGIDGISYYSFAFILTQMKNLKLDGIPYVDAKTFKGWIESGYKVKKGEKSKLSGITWIGGKKKDGKDDDDSFIYPKTYHIFHKSQVEKI